MREVTVNLNGCARCDGPGHRQITFRSLIRPIAVGDLTFSLWAPCPATGEPILMAQTEEGPYDQAVERGIVEGIFDA